MTAEVFGTQEYEELRARVSVQDMRLAKLESQRLVELERGRIAASEVMGEQANKIRQMNERIAKLEESQRAQDAMISKLSETCIEFGKQLIQILDHIKLMVEQP